MHVLIEGFDGTGKTTLARLLSLATGWPVVHQSPYKPRSREEFDAACSKALATTSREFLISDRWPEVTEYCYTTERRGNALDAVISALRDSGVDRVIHCDVDAVDELRIEARAGDLRDEEQTARVRADAPRVLAAYRGLMYQLRFAGFEVRRYRWQG